MEQPKLTYDFVDSGGINNSYVFFTEVKIGYEVKFKPSPYLVPDEPFADDVFDWCLS